jgi:hypothetical protein
MSTSQPVPSPEARPREQVFISGSMVNLREAASTKATVVKQVPIGTGCVVEEKAGSGWWRIGCGDSQGWTKAELLSTERPTLEPLLALAQDSKQPLKARFDAALRASALEPEHADARNLLWSLFEEQEWAQLESLLTEETGRRPEIHVSVVCEDESSPEPCLKGALQNPFSNAPSHLLEIHRSERLGRSLFMIAVLEEPYDKAKPPQLWVRTGTFDDGDLNALDIQVFAESRYVPSDPLKNALLEKLPKTGLAYRLSKVYAVLPSEELGAVQQLVGTWSELARRPRGFVRSYDCYENQGLRIHIEMLGNRVKVRLESQDYIDLDVGGVQLAKDGSITLRMVSGPTLKHTISRDDKRVSRWIGTAAGDLFDSYTANGFFVKSALEDAFPLEGPGPGECDE